MKRWLAPGRPAIPAVVNPRPGQLVARALLRGELVLKHRAAPARPFREPVGTDGVAREIAEAAEGWEAATVGAVDSGVPGPKGNREVFLHLVHRERQQLSDDIDAIIAAAIT